MTYRRKIGVFLVSLVLLALFTVACVIFYLSKATNGGGIKQVEFPPTPVISSTAASSFIEMAARNNIYEVNTGLTIERIGTIALEGIPTPSINFVSLLILNHTDEPLVFDDIGFGLQVFEYDIETYQWKEAKLPYVPEKKQKILPPKTESFNFDILNNWELNDQDLININTNIIRIFISGLGVNSNKNYGAYIDVTLQK